MKMIKILSIMCMLFLNAAAWAGHVDVNTADASTIAMELKGIGLKKEQAIIAYREANGAVKTIADLAKVKGVSDKTIEKKREKRLLGEK